MTSFDSRLVKLEKSILPLYTSTQTLTKRASSGDSESSSFLRLGTYGLLDVESALQKIDDVTSNQEGTAAEEALILRGCVAMCFGLRDSPLTLGFAFSKVLNLSDSTCI